MSERPFMQIHVGGLLASTLDMSAEEMGAYTLLLMAAWQQGGSLPADMIGGANLARLPLGRWSQVWPSLSHHFGVEDGRLWPTAFREWREAKARIYGRLPLPKELRLLVLARDGEECRYCGDTSGPFHIDHIVPVARGGTDDLANLCVACKDCNLSKGSKYLEDWL